MATTKNPVVHARNRLAYATRFNHPEDALAARLDMHAAKLERAIHEALIAPGITDEHRARFIKLLQCDSE